MVVYPYGFTDILFVRAGWWEKLVNRSLEIKINEFRNSLRVPVTVTSVPLTSWKFRKASYVRMIVIIMRTIFENKSFFPPISNNEF